MEILRTAGSRGKAIELFGSGAVQLLSVLAIYGAFIALVGQDRLALGYGTETDFLGGFVPEAKRVIEGQPVESLFHPPGYAFLLAGVYSLVGDWATSGYLISNISGAIGIIAAFCLFQQCFGPPYGLASSTALISAPVYLSFSSQASSDVIFAASFFSAAAVAVATCQSRRMSAAVLTGFLIGWTMMLRTNGVIAGALIFFPLVLVVGLRERLMLIASIASGAAIVIASFASFVWIAGGSLWPEGSVDNLAMAFYASGDRISNESMREVAGQFPSAIDVLRHDPTHVLFTYLRNLYDLGLQLPELLASALPYFVVPGLIFLILTLSSRISLGLLAVFLLALLLLNLMTFSPRFYIFIIPLLGLGVGGSFVLLVRQSGRFHRATLGFFGTVLALGIAQASLDARWELDRLGAEMYDLQRAGAFEAIPTDAAVVARKVHFSFYTGRDHVLIPMVNSVEALRNALLEIKGAEPMVLFMGQSEASTRPALASLRSPDEAPPWMIPLSTSQTPGDWAVYLLEF